EAPGSWPGIRCGEGTGYGRAPGIPSRFGMVPFVPHSTATRASEVTLGGRDGTERSGAARLRAPVRSPTAPRRQALRLGTSTPKRVSRKRSVDVWSKVSLHAKPPRAKGDTTRRGTRKPSPMGPPGEAFATVSHSPSVPAGAVGGGT